MQERRSRSRPKREGSEDGEKEQFTKTQPSIEIIKFHPPEDDHELENVQNDGEEAAMAQVSINDISFSEKVNDDEDKDDSSKYSKSEIDD